MSKFLAGFTFCLFSMLAWSAFSQQMHYQSSPGQFVTTATFMLAGGKDADGENHMLRMDKEGRVICATTP